MCRFENNVFMYTIHLFSQMVWVNFCVIRYIKDIIYVSSVISYVLRFEEVFK
jgi:hypothetical protein